MPPEDINFQTFFTAKVKDRGLSTKKLAEATGIAPAHLESLMQGRFDALPSAPYVHGYLVRLGKVLDFDGEEWWIRLKKERLVQNAGPSDSLPSNRFLRQSPARFVWIGIVAVIIILYLAFQLPIIFGDPSLSVTFPTANPYMTDSSTLTIEGTERGADSLFLNNGSSGDNENITIAADGSWQKSVLLQDGSNQFQITAKKLLGGQTSITEQIIYNGGSGSSLSASGTASSSNSGASPASTTASSSSAGQ